MPVPARRPGDPEPWPKKRWRCPHCYEPSTPAHCTTCNREMCDDCISIDPEVGPVCGLCYDRKYDPQD